MVISLGLTSLVVSPMDDASEFEGGELLSTSAWAHVATIRHLPSIPSKLLLFWDLVMANWTRSGRSLLVMSLHVYAGLPCVWPGGRP